MKFNVCIFDVLVLDITVLHDIGYSQNNLFVVVNEWFKRWISFFLKQVLQMWWNRRRTQGPEGALWIENKGSSKRLITACAGAIQIRRNKMIEKKKKSTLFRIIASGIYFRCVTKPRGRALIGVPTGFDAIYFNAHRLYGPLQVSIYKHNIFRASLP